MTIEEKRRRIKMYYIERTCNRCALKNRPYGSCYSDTRDAVIETNYKLIMEDMSKSDDSEVKEPIIMQDRVAIPVDKGTMTVKGTCYEDVLNILCRNGYATNIHTQPCKKNLSEIDHTIVFWKEPVSDNSYQE